MSNEEPVVENAASIEQLIRERLEAAVDHVEQYDPYTMAYESDPRSEYVSIAEEYERFLSLDRTIPEDEQ